MKNVLGIGSLLVMGLFAVYYTGTFLDVQPGVTTDSLNVERNGYGHTGVAVAETETEDPVQYPVEDFTGDTSYKVLGVVDGDTIAIDYKDEMTSVRLIGVDTPETGEPYSKQASDWMTNLLLGESVYLRFSTDQLNRRDQYGRLLAYLYRVPDGLFVNLELVRQGYGRVYTVFPFKQKTLFLTYQDRAQAAKKGLHQGSALELEGEVYVTPKGKRYHRKGCRFLGSSRIPFSVEEAQQKGYTACGICKP